MMDKKVFLEYPGKRIKAMDGLAVTAQVWEEAHDYHRRKMRLHNQLLHGAGIVEGLNVIASDPPDSSVYITPGIAVDPCGEIITVPEPVAFDLGQASNFVYLVLTYGESRPVQDNPTGPAYIRAEFSVEVKDRPDCQGGVVLARIRRERGASIIDASRPEFPGWNEIDLRFRTRVNRLGSMEGLPASLGIIYPAGISEFIDTHGTTWLARALRQAGQSVWVDDGIQLNADLERYDLLYLVSRDAFQLTREQMNHLYTYLGSGGTVFMDCCLKDSSTGPAPAAASYADLAASFGIELREVQRGHSLLSEPHLFGLPPVGFDGSENHRLMAGNGIILSEQDYGCIWQGERRDRPAQREEIRAAMEWGENILHYALHRKKEAKAE
jgi:hypothetical protein